ncbi:hypothetical protein P154DRAFT_539935 [Amniculicola lignicola CBS 123094]|uniref:Uncharacterized protein n=1 Tax=Amniculicola lignicola CBS 123094 TaxID=1392246 RepID=A0A6A5VW47_9PLEO|nr:hypothetical protein P154DRAFT_539935 [Amniculicola lignicola CBS 123094]
MGHVDGQGPGKVGDGIKECIAPYNQVGSAGLGSISSSIHPEILELEERAASIRQRNVEAAKNKSKTVRVLKIFSEDLQQEIEEIYRGQQEAAWMVFATVKAARDAVDLYSGTKMYNGFQFRKI